jgi:hypothetical protein
LLAQAVVVMNVAQAAAQAVYAVLLMQQAAVGHLSLLYL